ncbi:hypothetical protein ACFV4K_11780 [Nocardia sp. NPDC059764]|uniref:hypothetical protein n=1 Tax=Nocardia sp. NPDC059764 TaxID=3346939 RepID=UPI003650D365
MTSLWLEVLYEGAALTLYGLVKDEVCEASRWLAGCDKRTKAQFAARFERLTTVGYLRSPEEMRQLQCTVEPPVSEIKTQSGHRLYVIRHNKDWVATHGEKKPSDRKVCDQAKKAIKIWEEAHTR